MKILLLCNMMPKQVSEYLNIPFGNGGGWISSLIEELSRSDNNKLIICYQHLRFAKYDISDKVTAYEFPYEKNIFQKKKQAGLCGFFKNVIDREQPDIVHIFGTENVHTGIMVRAFDNPTATVIHIQGLVYYISKAYTQGLPERIIKKKTLMELLRGCNIAKMQDNFKKRGYFEIEAIRNVGHIMGRTDWDRACSMQINPNAQYHFVQEIMREPFYTGEWNLENCKRHTVFVSQAQYPIKGFHFVLEAVKILKRQWQDIQINIGGRNICDVSTLKNRITQTSYAKYIKKLIKEYGLENNIRFLGPLDAEEMKQQFLDCNVFVSASTIENSPNSVAEAMLLGVPVVSSDVGGVSSIMDHRKEGYLYPSDEPYMMAFYIDNLFKNGDDSERIGRNASARAHKAYDRDQAVQNVLSVYNEIIRKKQESSK